MNPPETQIVTEQWIDPEVEASFRALPTEDDLPYDDGEPMETARHRDQMILLIESLKAYWSDRQDYYVGGNMFVHYTLSIDGNSAVPISSWCWKWMAPANVRVGWCGKKGCGSRM